MVRSVCRSCVASALLLLSAVHASGEDKHAQHVLFDETFDERSDAWVSAGATIADGQLTLSCPSDRMYDGTQLIFTPTLKLPASGEGNLHLQFVLAGAQSPNGVYSARFFLLPTRPAPQQFVDPYGKEHCLTLEVFGDDKGATVSLFSHSIPGAGFGVSLYSGSFSAEAFPLSVDLRADRKIFRLQFGSDVETKTGSRSGSHGLAEAKWQGDLSWGIRLVTCTQGNKPHIRFASASAALELANLSAASESGGRARARSPVSATVRVHPLVAQAAEGYDQVQALFGGNVNGHTKGKADAILRELDLNTSRLHMWPDTYGTPPSMRPPATPSFVGQFGTNGGYFKVLPADEVEAAWDRWFRLDFNSFLDPCISRGVAAPNGGSMESQLSLQKAWGSTDNIVFFTTMQLDSNAIRNADGACRYFDQYLDAVEKHAPWIDATFAQLTNEPNYGWWVGGFRDPNDAVDGWISLYNDVDVHLRKTHPKTRLLGPCLASCAFFSWGDWKKWTVPVLRDAALDMEHFNYHNYETPAVSHLAWVEMLQAQAQALGRTRPRAVVTEMNDDANLGKAGRKFEWWSEQLFYALENPDKYRMFHYFMTHSDPNGSGEWGNLVSSKAGTYVPTDTYWLFWVLRQTRGSVRHVESVGVTDLKAFACAPTDDQLVVSLFNNTGRLAKVTVRSGLPYDAKIQRIVRRSAHRQAGIIWHEEEALDAEFDVEAELPPGAVQSFTWNLAEPLLQPMQKVDRLEFYAKAAGEKFSKPLSVPIETPRRPRRDETVCVRFAAATDDVLAARGLTVSVNGYAQSVAWTEAPREETRSQRSVWWMEVPIPRAKVARANTVAFSDVGAAYRLMFASLVYRQHPSPREAREAEAKALALRQEGVAASFAPLGPIFAGENKETTLTLENRRDRPVSCAVYLALPQSLTLEGGRAETQIELPAKGKRQVRAAVRAGDSDKIQFLSVEATVEEKGGDARVYPAAAVLYPKRNANRFWTPPVMDGNLTEWREADAITQSQNGTSVRLRLGWDKRCLYLAAEVVSGRAPARPVNPGHFWEGDVLELFLDIWNKKSPIYCSTDGQFYFCPYEGEDGETVSGFCQRVRKGDAVVYGETLTSGPWEVASQAKDDGYVLECKLPWAVLAKDFVPEPGTRVGMDVAIRGFESLFGAEGKPYDKPRMWGILNLK